ncbi:uncharacterized protein BO72DRAFT_505451 [Aspergillus fijiensis CBS 313.89]|uniref:Uncharacterized protein n=1 Tax=Aspergillus fijiensis CBS 313.89 TaxID=1448319 RepID=A0A8G1RSD9_9EURO|nr:uncharacterized protein BO72DRAFT_505451 [Aspergillus fijiensis CBS 313.89]RAK79342.1 hypothetical protein BO72DRAFT_505451 [Aspergillus fijiensis CBS 313.89]
MSEAMSEEMREAIAAALAEVTREAGIEAPPATYSGTYYRVGQSSETTRYGIIGGILEIDGTHYGLTSMIPFLYRRRPSEPPAFSRSAIYSVETDQYIGGPPPDRANEAEPDPRFWSREQGWALVNLGPKPEHWTNYWYHDMTPDKVVTPQWPVSLWRGFIPYYRTRRLIELLWDSWLEPVTFRMTKYGQLHNLLVGPVSAYRMRISIPYHDLLGAWVVDAESEALVAMIVAGPRPSENPRTVYAVDATIILDELARRFPGVSITIPNRHE